MSPRRPAPPDPSPDGASGRPDLLLACATRLVSVAPLLMREFRAEMRRSAPADLSVPLFRSLILANGRPGASVSDLANHLGVTLPTASVAVDKLGARGLLQAAEPGQRRKLLLTPAGAELVERARGDATSAFERRLGGLAPDQLRQIDAALVALESALTAVPAGRPTSSQPAPCAPLPTDPPVATAEAIEQGAAA